MVLVASLTVTASTAGYRALAGADCPAAPYGMHRIIRLAEAESGALRHLIVLMHNQPAGNPATVSALSAIIRFFRSRGYRFVIL
ncbi:MAG TPA: hypothetical protein VMK84_28975 [Streptosporangiaceae bacterium]|nr:hypothetical protein [Streptosporangiaceae bacterium]